MSSSGRCRSRARARRRRSRRRSTGFNALAGAAGPADRRPRRRLDRGFVGVQRGSRGARGRRLGDPDHLRGRPRDRHHLVRLRRRRARADADRRRRDGGAGARRAARPGARARRAGRALRPADGSSAAPSSSQALLRHWPEREAPARAPAAAARRARRTAAARAAAGGSTGRGASSAAPAARFGRPCWQPPHDARRERLDALWRVAAARPSRTSRSSAAMPGSRTATAGP